MKKIILIIPMSFLLSCCYSIKQGTTMIKYLNRAVPLEIISDAGFIARVHDIRRFATEELGLKESRNYTKYVELDRDYLAAVVSASAEDSFSAYEWNYPVVGKMPYKGFFDIEGARRERAKLEKKGLDVWIRGVDAFSTLGWFKDPLYSYMRSYSSDRLADLIIHELLHATVFIKGRVKFNEELAEFTGSEGARLYMVSRFGFESAEYNDMITAETDSKKFIGIIQDLIEKLDVLYSSGADHEKLLQEKKNIISAAQEKFEIEYDNNFKSDRYRGFSKLEINNAYLDLYRLYHPADNFYEDLYERGGKDLTAFIAAAKTISKKGDPRTQLANALGF
ncbi:MAG: aminopeptidase [Treponema sp.]|jgi:predicted aminopeptidase|nr:aminopeptidase [Treponema sp.]